MPGFAEFHKVMMLTKTGKTANLSLGNLEAIMFTPSIVISCMITTALLFFILRNYHSKKIIEALRYQSDLIAYGKGSAVVGLAMFANAFTNANRTFAINHLVTLATLNDNHEAFLALRDHIDPRVLRRMLKTWHTNNPIQDILGRGDLKPFVHSGSKIGHVHGKKLICFVMGMRTQEHLASDLTEAEHLMLRDRFDIPRPLEVIKSTTG